MASKWAMEVKVAGLKRPISADYSEPGEYLRDLYKYSKNKSPGSSHRYIAHVLGLKSPSIFIQIINGRVHPSKRVIEKLGAIFQLNDEERLSLADMFKQRRVDMLLNSI